MALFTCPVRETRSNNPSLINNTCCKCKGHIEGPVYVALDNNRYTWGHCDCMFYEYPAVVGLPTFENFETEFVPYVKNCMPTNRITTKTWLLLVSLFVKHPHFVGLHKARSIFFNIVKNDPPRYRELQNSNLVAFEKLQTQLVTLRDRDAAITVWALRDTCLTHDIIRKIVNLVIF